jgi:hypothetical protein
MFYFKLSHNRVRYERCSVSCLLVYHCSVFLFPSANIGSIYWPVHLLSEDVSSREDASTAWPFSSGHSKKGMVCRLLNGKISPPVTSEAGARWQDVITFSPSKRTGHMSIEVLFFSP